MSFRVIDNVSNGIALFLVELASSDSGVDSQNFANEISEPSANTPNSFKGIRYSSFAIDVGVENTMDMLEVSIGVFDDE
jgi:hypothetical protein